MIQTQLLNPVPNLPPGVRPATVSKKFSDARQGKFENIMNPPEIAPKQPQAYSSAPKADRLKGQAINDPPDIGDTPANPWPKPQADTEPSPLYFLFTNAPPLDRPLEFFLDAANQRPPQILDTIVSILEGNQNIILNNKEIVPLIAEPLPAWRQTEQPLAQAFEEKLSEVMARMPQSENISETPLKQDNPYNCTVTPRGSSCPPENVNEDQNQAAQLKVEYTAPLAAQTAPAASISEQGADTKDTFSQGQTKPQPKAPPPAMESDDALPQGASFNIAPARLAFGERFSAAADQSLRPLSADNLFAAMVERIVSLPEASPHMEISLKPDHLGKLTIDLRLSENGLSAKILASDEGVRNLLASHINSLGDTLAERGIRLDNVQVLYSALGDKASGFQQPKGQEAHKNAPQKNTAVDPVDALLAAFAENIYDTPLIADDLWGISSVEYRA